MKTIAARFDDDLFATLAMVAELEGTPIVDQIRLAVEAHIALKVADGELANRAEAALDEIDREAAAKKAAIAGLVGAVSKSAPKSKAPSRRQAKPAADKASSDSSDSPSSPMGFAPGRTATGR